MRDSQIFGQLKRLEDAINKKLNEHMEIMKSFDRDLLRLQRSHAILYRVLKNKKRITEEEFDKEKDIFLAEIRVEKRNQSLKNLAVIFFQWNNDPKNVQNELSTNYDKWYAEVKIDETVAIVNKVKDEKFKDDLWKKVLEVRDALKKAEDAKEDTKELKEGRVKEENLEVKEEEL